MEYEMLRALRPIRCFLLDMDGTIYLGDRLLPKAAEFIEYLKASGRGFLFLTNNSSKDKTAYVEKLSKLGIPCEADDILTSGEATCIYLQGRAVHKVYLLGTPELEAEFQRWGFRLTAESPDVVVIGFDKTLTYAKLVTACDLLRKGVPYVATHPDINCPMEDSYIPDCGAMIELIAASTGCRPKVIGKPNREIIESAFKKRPGFSLAEFAMVGDRLYTDVATGNHAGICSILVLSGESTRQDVEQSDVKPHLIAENVAQLLEALQILDHKAE